MILCENRADALKTFAGFDQGQRKAGNHTNTYRGTNESRGCAIKKSMGRSPASETQENYREGEQIGNDTSW